MCKNKIQIVKFPEGLEGIKSITTKNGTLINENFTGENTELVIISIDELITAAKEGRSI